MLFANPRTYPEEAIKLMRNSYLPNMIDQLRESLLVEIRISEVRNGVNALMFPDFKARFLDKLDSWVKAFAFPLPKELAEIPGIFTSVSETEVFFMLARIAVGEEMTPERILEYLSKYAALLPKKIVDDCLDNYNRAMAVIDKVDGIQLKLQFG